MTSDVVAGTASRSRERTSVRLRILAWVVALSAAGAVASGALTVVAGREAVRDRIDAGLEREVEEFRQFAAGDSQAPGAVFTSVEELARQSLQRNVPNADESLFAVVNGELLTGPERDRSFRPEQDESFLAQVVDPYPGPPRPRTATTGEGDVRYIAVPLTMAGTPDTGVYVVAADVEAGLGEVSAAARRAALADGITLIVVALVGWLVAGRLLRPLRAVRETARRISDTDLSERIPVSGKDEVAELARTFNDMLDRLEATAAEQRLFLDDAGHELRTPLTILRGHLEVLDPADEAEVAETRMLLLDEVDRMSRLVNDLALLTRARRPDFVRPAPVHVGELVHDVLAKIDPLGRRRWTLDAAPDIVVHADRQRLTQALMQLAANAVTFTGDRDVVALGAEVHDGALRIWVRDTGPGIDPGDHERIFERFGRATGSHAVEGSGLGLAIVSAIAQGHGGTVEVDSRLGRGARFTIVLPAPGLADTAPGEGLEQLRPWERA